MKFVVILSLALFALVIGAIVVLVSGKTRGTKTNQAMKINIWDHETPIRSAEIAHDGDPPLTLPATRSVTGHME